MDGQLLDAEAELTGGNGNDCEQWRCNEGRCGADVGFWDLEDADWSYWWSIGSADNCGRFQTLLHAGSAI